MAGPSNRDAPSSQLFPIWLVALFAVGLYVVMHYLTAGANRPAPCEVQDWSMLWLAVVPLGVIVLIAFAALLFAQSKRPLGIVKARIAAHVARVLLALVIAGFSLAILAVAIRAWAATVAPPVAVVEPVSIEVTKTPLVGVATGGSRDLQRLGRDGSGALTLTPPTGAGTVRLRDRVRVGVQPAVQCRAALPSRYLHAHPVRVGIAVVLVLGGLGVLFYFGVWKKPRRAASWLRWLPSPALRWITFGALLAWPSYLVIDAVSEAGFDFFAKNFRIGVVLASAGYVAWWATGRVFGGLALVTTAAHEFDVYNSSPRGDYTASLATEDHADVLVFSDMHLTALSDGHPLRTMDSTTQSFDDGTAALVDELISRVKPKAVIVAGDVTDTGHASAWERARALFARSGIPCYIAPGNHDVHFRWLTPELVDQRGANRLVLREVFAMDLPRDEASDSVADTEVAAHLDTITPPAQCVEGEPFPRLHHDPTLKLSVLILDSNRRPPSSPISNAIGLVGSDQIARANALLSSRPDGHGLVIVLHHHVIPPDDLEHHATLRCEDAADVLALAAAHRAAAVIHGHKHMPYVVRHRVDGHELYVISCGSTLYAAQGPRKDTVKRASAVGLRVEDGAITDVAFFTSR